MMFSKNKNHAQVLVVGAGPVGMFSALRLAQQGFQVRVIDKEARTATRSYACALHPGTLHLLWQAGLAPNCLERANRINSIGLYDGHERRAQIKLSDLPLEFPYVLVLPQDDLENLLEAHLKQFQNVQLDWNCRLRELRADPAAAIAGMDKLGQTVIGYSVPDFEGVVEKSLDISADFLVGADGSNSMVRRCLAIESQEVGTPELFAVYEFESARGDEDEMKVVLAGDTVSVMWPLGINKCRWSFQVISPDEPGDFPEKERRRFILHEASSDHDSRHHLLQFLEQRTPWFPREIDEVDWSAELEFPRRIARNFGRHRCWLAGDAAHQTGPIGVQSMNVGLHEAAHLAESISRILQKGNSFELLQAYNSESQTEWRRLLGLNGPPRPTEKASPWIKQHCADLPAYLPASGKVLSLLLSELGLQFD